MRGERVHASVPMYHGCLFVRHTLAFIMWLAVGSTTAMVAPAEAAADDLLAVTLNIWHDQDRWPARLSVMLDTLRALEPDVILLQEVLQNDSFPNQAHTLAESLNYDFVFASVDPPAASKRYGNAILTRHRIVEANDVKLEPLNDYRVVAHALLDVNGHKLDTYVTHLHHTFEGRAIRGEQVEHLVSFIEKTRSGRAILLGGDFNAPPDAAELQPILATLTDAFGAVHTDRTGILVSTLNPAKGHQPRRIDYLFVEPEALQPVASGVFLDEPTEDGLWASDHFGVWARFHWVP